MESKTIYAVVLDTMVPAYGNRRVTLFQSGGDGEAECPCGASISFQATPAEADRVIAAFCTQTCYAEHHGEYFHIPHLEASVPKEVKSTRPEFCPECNGGSKGRGHDHTSDCSHAPAKQQADQAAARRAERGNCSDCGGPPGRGRGWKHKPGCSKVTVNREVQPPCAECGGIRRGRGYSHAEGCSLKPQGYVSNGKPRGGFKGLRRRKMPAGCAA